MLTSSGCAAIETHLRQLVHSSYALTALRE
jgi:hypothetical protein